MYIIMFRQLKEDLESIKKRDPAAKSRLEIFFLYSGYKALIFYRLSHWFYKKGHTFIARKISQSGRFWTGIEIHPGATIGKGLFIDHGAGVVIGETAEVGDYCTIFQGVTLGGTGKEQGKRHPTLGNHVLVGAGAKILGPFRVGDNAKIAAGAVLLKEVPPGATAVGVPAKVVRVYGSKNNKANENTKTTSMELDQIHVPDPITTEFYRLSKHIKVLEEELRALKKEGTLSSEKTGENTPPSPENAKQPPS